jgi:hypothetical protein
LIFGHHHLEYALSEFVEHFQEAGHNRDGVSGLRVQIFLISGEQWAGSSAEIANAD